MRRSFKNGKSGVRRGAMKKRLISVAAAITASFILTAAALAAAEFANIHELFGHWEANGYPDYFSSVCAADGDKAELMVFLTDPDAEDTIREMSMTAVWCSGPMYIPITSL